MLIEKDYCDYGTTVALEELGFPLEEDYGGVYIKSCGYKRPLLYEAQKWLREEKGIHIEILYQPATWTCKIYNLKNKEYIKGYTFFVSYEEALSEGIKEAIKILKDGIGE